MSRVSHQMVATVADTDLRLSLTWDPTNPFAVVMDMYPAQGPVRWVFAWELLEDGVHGPAGIGDIRICPDAAGHTMIVLIRGADRQVLQVDTAAVKEFLADTWMAEPPELPDYIPTDFEASP
jgi:hypothetical protein